MRIYNNKNKIWTVVADQWRPKYVVPGQRRKKKRDITDSTIDVGKFFGMLEKSTYTMQSIINKCYSFQFSFSFFFFLIPIGFWRFFVLPGTCRIEYNTRSILRCRIFYDDGSSACWSHSSWCDFGLTDSDPTTGKHLFFIFFSFVDHVRCVRSTNCKANKVRKDAFPFCYRLDSWTVSKWSKFFGRK